MAKRRVHRSGVRAASGDPAGAPKRTGGGGAASAASAPRPSLREQFEDISAPFLLRMRELPAFLLPVLLAIMLFFGLVVASPWAGVLLVLIALFLSWLTAVSWPAISSGSRVLRVVVDVGMLALGGAKLLGYLG